ncbi:MAG: hypothetical protein MJY89_06575 [Bacteroidales bacterium]|nr:hypothetical protein [Bacteroidales bacterium]
MKKLLLLAIAGLFAVNAGAQWTVSSIDNSEDSSIEFKGVLEISDAVLVYGTYTASVDYDRVSFDPGTAVYAGGQVYPLKNAINIPLNNGGKPCSAAFNKMGEKVNFVMEFEKFPLTEKFDIVENAKNHKGASNYYGISLVPAGVEFFENTEAFLEEYPVTLMGYYYEGNVTYAYRIRNNVCLTCRCSIREGDLFEPLDRVYTLDVINKGDHPVYLDREKVWATGHRRKNDGSVTTQSLKHYNLGDYGEYETEMDGATAIYYVAGVKDLSYQLRMAKLGEGKDLDLNVLKVLEKMSDNTNVVAYLSDFPTKHLSALTSGEISPGESFGGFIATQEKDGLGYYILHANVDGYVYTFTWK